MGHYLSEMLHPEPAYTGKKEVDNSEFHIIHSRNKWGIFPKNGNRSKANFKHRDLAFHDAISLAVQYRAKIIIHNTDGSVDFIFNTYYETEQQKRANNLR
jgi:hypothetical protein